MTAVHVVAVPSESFVPERSPLQGIFQLDQCLALRSVGTRVGVVAVDADTSLAHLLSLRRPPPFLPGTTHRTESGFDVVESRVLPVRYGSAGRRCRYWVRAGERAFRAYAGRFGMPDVVHAHNARYAGVLAARLQDRWGVPYVLTEHSSIYARATPEADELARLRRAFRGAAHVVAVSDHLADTLRELRLADTIEVVPNTVDSVFAAASPPADGRIRLLAVGALTHLKNHQLAVEAFELAFPEGDAELRIAGDGPCRAELQSFILHRQLGDRVFLVGSIPRGEVAAELDRATALVHASAYETFGVAVAEALMAGRPVVTTDCGGPSSFVGPDDGFVVPVGDIETFADALRHLPSRRFSSAGIRQRALERFGEEAVGSTLAAILSSAAARTAREPL